MSILIVPVVIVSVIAYADMALMCEFIQLYMKKDVLQEERQYSIRICKYSKKIGPPGSKIPNCITFLSVVLILC